MLQGQGFYWCHISTFKLCSRCYMQELNLSPFCNHLDVHIVRDPHCISYLENGLLVFLTMTSLAASPWNWPLAHNFQDQEFLTLSKNLLNLFPQYLQCENRLLFLVHKNQVQVLFWIVKDVPISIVGKSRSKAVARFLLRTIFKDSTLVSIRTRSRNFVVVIFRSHIFSKIMSSIFKMQMILIFILSRTGNSLTFLPILSPHTTLFIFYLKDGDFSLP